MARILLVDDDIELSEMLASVLRIEGYEVLSVHVESEAVPLMLKERPDLAILDVMFPENPVAGFDIARAARMHEELKAMPIIILTAFRQEFPMDFSPEDINDDWMPIQDFIEKPTQLPLLLEKIKRLTET